MGLASLPASVVSLAFPQHCLVCTGPVEWLSSRVACEACWKDVSILSGEEMLCGRCGSKLGEAAAPHPVFCRKCDEHEYDRAFAVGVYDGALREEILELKRVPRLSRQLVQTLSASLSERLSSIAPDILIPVPLAKARRLERGFNQAEVIATEVSRIMGIPCDAHSLRRSVNTHVHRTGMDQRARESTVLKAFEATRPKLLAGRDVLLVDDVLTSGATASACASTLKKAGVGRVFVLTLARAVLR